MSLWSGLHPRRSCHSCAPRHAEIVMASEPRVLLGLRFSMLHIRLEAVFSVLFAINRSDMRWVSIEIWSSDSKLFFVGIDPIPQLLTRSQSLRTCLALNAHDIRRGSFHHDMTCRFEP